MSDTRQGSNTNNVEHMENKHTPGPWHIGVRQPNSDKFIYGPNGSEVANCDRQTNFPHENEANARLIAAAPELLGALQICSAELFAQCGDNARAMQYVKQARQAIAKATQG